VWWTTSFISRLTAKLWWVWRSPSNRGCQVYLQAQVPSAGFVVAGCQWKWHKRTSVFQSVYISKCLPVLHKFIQKHHKTKYCFLAWFYVCTCTLRKEYVGPIRRPKNWIRSKGIKCTKRPTDAVDRKILDELEKFVLSSGDCVIGDWSSGLAVIGDSGTVAVI
jgi:hypothetical protein